MKVLLLNDLAPPVGGAEIVTLLLREGLRARGHDVRLFASSVGLEGAAGPADYTCFGTTGRLRTLNRVANPAAVRALRRVLGSFRPDVVHARMLFTQLSPLVLPLLRDTPSVYHAAWYEAICPTGLKLLPDGAVCQRPLGSACRGCLSRRAWGALMVQHRLWERWRGVFDLVVANSETTRQRLAAHGLGPTERVWNGVPARAARPPLSGPPTVAYAGRLSREKGVEDAVHAFALLADLRPDARLVVLGDGPLRADLERFVCARGLEGRVVFSGHVTRDVVERTLDAAWVQVSPSLLEEPFGNAVGEALMRGTAVVATAMGASIELIRDGETGILVPPGSPGELAAAVEALLADRDRTDALGMAGRAWACRQLSVDAFVDRIAELHAGVVAGLAGRAA